MYRFGHHAHHPVIGILLLVLLVAVLVLAIIALVRFWKTHPGHASSTPPGWLHGHGHADPALTELRMRFARGEITSDEYRQRASHLGYQVPAGENPGGPPPEVQTQPPAV